MRRVVVTGIVGTLGLLGAFLFVLYSQRDALLTEVNASAETRVISIDDTLVRVVVADTPQARTQGLSGQNGLGAGTGMLFVFFDEGTHGIWMKDMLFSIDILWISATNEVIHIEKNVAPETYPAAFRSTQPARYVLEVSAGFAEEHNIIEGSKVSF